MKKLFFVMVLLVAALVVNAQQDTVKTTKSKSTTTTTAAPQQAVRATVKTADLLKPIADNVAKDYAGYTVKEATSVTLGNVVTYEVLISKGTETETLVYDKDGKFLKKMEL